MRLFQRKFIENVYLMDVRNDVFPWDPLLTDMENLDRLEERLLEAVEENYRFRPLRIGLSFSLLVNDNVNNNANNNELRVLDMGQQEILPQNPVFISRRLRRFRARQISLLIEQYRNYVRQYGSLSEAVMQIVYPRGMNSGDGVENIAYVNVFYTPIDPNNPDDYNRLVYGNGILPVWLRQNPHIYSMGGKMNNDGLCVFRCLALALGKTKMQYKSTNAAHKLLEESGLREEAKLAGKQIDLPYGCTNSMLDKLEQHFQISINVYTMKEDVVHVIRESEESYPIVDLHAYIYSSTGKRAHMSLIRNIYGFTKTFECKKCLRIFDTISEHDLHALECSGNASRVTFPKDSNFIAPQGRLWDFRHHSSTLQQLHNMVNDFVVLDDHIITTIRESYVCHDNIQESLNFEQRKYQDRWNHISKLISGKTKCTFESTINHWSRRLVVVQWNNSIQWTNVKKMDYNNRFIETDKLFIIDFSKFHSQLSRKDLGDTLDVAIRQLHAHFMKYHISIFHDIITLPKTVQMLMFDGVHRNHVQVPVDKDTFYLLKDAIVGGMGQVNRHLASPTCGNFVSVESWDCTSMYAYALSRDMPCGKSFYCRLDKPCKVSEILERIKNKSFVGFIRCSVNTPEHLRSKFFDLPIIVDKSCKNVYSSKDIVLWCKLAEFYLQQGLTIEPTEYVEYEYSKPLFASYVEHCVRDRMEADLIGNKAMIQIQKFKLSAAHGMTHINPKNHPDILVCDTKQAFKHIKDYHFKYCQILDDKIAIMKTREKILHQEPIQIAAAVYAESKLHFFQFFYNCLKTSFDNTWEPLAVQTDAIVIGLRKKSLMDCKLPNSHISDWFCDDQTKRVPGLFHLDKKAKCYVGYGQNNYSITNDEPNITRTFKNRKRIINADGYTTSPGNNGS